MNFGKTLVLNMGIHILQQVCKQIHTSDHSDINYWE